MASLTTCCVNITSTANGESNALTILSKSVPSQGAYLARVDAQPNNQVALWWDYHCKLQTLSFPAPIGTPYANVPGTRPPGSPAPTCGWSAGARWTPPDRWSTMDTASSPRR